jgi:glycosyltransferase involved in cell wall biosynthesis
MLYVGGLWRGCTGLERKLAFEKIGLKVTSFDTDPYVRNRNRIELALTHRLAWGPAVWSLNRDLVEFVKGQEYDLVWVSRGIWIYSSTVEALKKNNKALVVHYNMDDPFGYVGKQRWRVFVRAIPSYDIHFVPRKVNLREYQEVGAKKAIQLMPFRGYSPRFHNPSPINPEIRKTLGGPAGFVGDYELLRAKSMLYLAENNVPVRIWGPNWSKRCQLSHPNLKIEDRGLYAENYANAIKSFDINIAFLRKCSRDLHTSRSVEIPACGAFFLSERTSEHLELFEEGKEAEFFDNDEELLDKVKYYLAHPEEREKIAKAGLERCIKSGYDVESRMREYIKVILNQ